MLTIGVSICRAVVELLHNLISQKESNAAPDQVEIVHMN